MEYPPRDPCCVRTSYPLEVQQWLSSKGYDVGTQQRSRGGEPIQGEPGDAVPWPEREVSSPPFLFPCLPPQAAQER
jgi:hypothetical protein